ncbi:TolC family protein [Paraburkholderia xenovorans]|uniref:hypothetical protein n=1 Tax=Paraburkholderia xenovorans TaxID=36873 RepID=UPI0038BC2404
MPVIARGRYAGAVCRLHAGAGWQPTVSDTCSRATQPTDPVGVLMKMMAFGELRFDRESIPAELRDVASWPGADDGALSSEARHVLQRRIQAMALFVDGHLSLREIGRVTGLRFKDLYRLFDRCVTMHEDGRIFGVRALIPYAHTRAYQRSAAVTLSRDGVKGGTSGAFTQLLLRYPEIARWIERKVDERRRKNGGQREVLRGLRRLHRDFLDQCRRAGVEAHNYPFNQQHLGERSLATHVRRLANRHFDAAAQAAGATQIAHPWEDAGEHVRKPAVDPFDVIEFDGHKIDLRVTLRVDDPLGFETLLALHRIWILVLLDVATRAVIGYSLALGREYSKDDIAEALQATLTPPATRAFRIPGLRVRSGGGFPSVEQALARVRRQEQLQAARIEEVSRRSEVLRKTMRQYEVGDIGRINIDQARVALLESQTSLVREQVGLLQGQVALFRAMGGGWQRTGAGSGVARLH